MTHEKAMVCIVCPKGCRMSAIVGQNASGLTKIISISGFACNRGKDYAEQEILEPRRILTTTVKTEGAAQKRLAVRSDREIPLDKLRQVVAELRKLRIVPPVSAGVCIAKKDRKSVV